jgi:hypothetical protein
MGAVLENVREEIIQRIYLLDPEIFPGQQFEAYEPEATKGEPIRENPGKHRLFSIEYTPPERLTVGSANRKYNVSGFIIIGYPQGTEWTVAAIADYDKIHRTLIDNSTTVTGCDWRESAEDPVIEPDIENQWQWLLIPLNAVIETTA